tara:strand:- start:1982 stop:2194 length:213 start_codon:yes stop_codon:yes gene_type:complete
MLSAAEHIELAVFVRHIENMKSTSKYKNAAPGALAPALGLNRQLNATLNEEAVIMNYFESKISLLKERLP